MAAWVTTALAILAGILAEDQRGAAQRDLGAVRERDPPDRLAVDEGAVGRAQVDQDYLVGLDAQLGMVRDTPGSTRRRSQSVPRPSSVTGVCSS